MTQRYVICPAYGEFAVYDTEADIEIYRYSSRARAEQDIADYLGYARSFTAQDMEPMTFTHWLDAKWASKQSGDLHHAFGDHGYATH